MAIAPKGVFPFRLIPIHLIPIPGMLGLGIGLGLGLVMGLGIGLRSGFEYFRQYNVIRRIGIRRIGIRQNGAEPSKMAKGANLKFLMRDPKQSSDMTAKKSRKGSVVTVTWPLIFWALNANISKMAKGVNLKFGMHDPR